MRKNSKQAIKVKPKKQSRLDKSITVHVPVDVYTPLKKLAGEHDMSINALLNFYIEQIVEQEIDDVPALANADNPLPDSEKKESLAQDEKYFAKSSGIKYEKIGIGSTFFANIYFKNLIPVLIGNVLLTTFNYLIMLLSPPYNPVMGYVWVSLFPILSIIWATGCIVFGCIRKNGSYILAGWGWLAGVISAVVILITMYQGSLGFLELNMSSLFALLSIIVFIGLIVNVPVEISNMLNNRRIKQINARVPEWGDEIIQILINREIRPDMTKEMVLLAWGSPTVIESQEATKNSFTEKWVYKSSLKSIYVWFTNGVVNKTNDIGV